MGAILAVTSAKGGVGKSTSAVHLAGRAAARGMSVVVCDCDSQHHAAKWLQDSAPDMHVERLADTEELLKNVGRLASTADLLVIDLAGGDVAGMRLAMLKSDLVVMPVSSSLLDLDSLDTTCTTLQEARDIIGREGVPRAIIQPNRMAPTKVAREVLEAAELLATECGATMGATVPVRAAIADAAGQHQFVWDLTDGDAAEAMLAACDYILDQAVGHAAGGAE